VDSSPGEPSVRWPGAPSVATVPTNSYVIRPGEAASALRSRSRLSPSPTRTTRRRIPAARSTSSETDSYAARKTPIVMADVTTAVGMSPEVVKS
jgi:hypothetical protein